MEKIEFDLNDFKTDIESILINNSLTGHNDILEKLLSQFKKVDFRELTQLKEQNERVGKKHHLITCIEEVLKKAISNNWGICKVNDFIYLFNGAYWKLVEKDEFQLFLGEAAEKMGIDKYDARHYLFREQLFKQFLATAILPKPDFSGDTVLVNLKNGTFEISPKKQILRHPNRQDFLKYQLPFDYNVNAEATLFKKYLNSVQPDMERQNILAEYIGYLFIKPSALKLEKALLLYGSGANGKSVFFEIVSALLGGTENVSNYSLQSLTNESGYYRAMLSNKLVNYASEISNKLDTSIFKQLVSGEPIEARLPYGDPFTVTNYAKLIFNCNELPKDAELSNAYFRRFLIVPFDITIPEANQDKQLAQKIINDELSGVFNWVLEGLDRLLSQKKFTTSIAVDKQIECYKRQSDSVLMFLEEDGYEKSIEEHSKFKEVFGFYKTYCQENGYRSCSTRTFGDRLRNSGFELKKINTGVIIYLKKVSFS